MASPVMVIEPYWNSGTWVFDNEAVELGRGPLIEGVPQMVDELVKDIPNARSGFRLFFSSLPFPEYRIELTLVSGDYGGNWYRASGSTGESCLCPAMSKCFAAAPERIYLRAEPLGRQVEPDVTEVSALKDRIEELERAVYRLTMENELLKSGDTQPPPEYRSPADDL